MLGLAYKQSMRRMYMEEKGNAYTVLVEKPEGKRPLGWLRRKWEDNNVKVDLQELGWESVDWINLA
jgi:hypothetical protein